MMIAQCAACRQLINRFCSLTQKPVITHLVLEFNPTSIWTTTKLQKFWIKSQPENWLRSISRFLRRGIGTLCNELYSRGTDWGKRAGLLRRAFLSPDDGPQLQATVCAEPQATLDMWCPSRATTSLGSWEAVRVPSPTCISKCSSTEVTKCKMHRKKHKTFSVSSIHNMESKTLIFVFSKIQSIYSWRPRKTFNRLWPVAAFNEASTQWMRLEQVTR